MAIIKPYYQTYINGYNLNCSENKMQLSVVSEKVVYGLTIRTDNVTEMNPEKGKISALYQAFNQAMTVDYANGERVFGVYYGYESDHTGEFNVLAGVARNHVSDITLTKIVIPQGKYLMFTQQGEMPQAVIQAWSDIWQYFSSDEAEYERLFSTDFEYYKNENKVEVYIAIK